MKTFVTEFGLINYMYAQRLTQRSSFIHLGQPKLPFSLSDVKFDIWSRP